MSLLRRTFMFIGTLPWSPIIIIGSILFVVGICWCESGHERDRHVRAMHRLRLQVEHDHGCPADTVKVLTHDERIYVYRVAACGHTYWYQGVDGYNAEGYPTRFQWNQNKKEK